MNTTPYVSRLGFLVAFALALACLNSAAASHQTNSVEGWRVLVNERLLKEEKAATEKALELLRVQLLEIVRVVPGPAVAKLREVPLWFSPAYPGVKPRRWRLPTCVISRPR